MKYLESERFIVDSNDKEARRKYNENYDRIFGNASGSSQDVEARQVAPAPEAAADSDAIEVTLKQYPAEVERFTWSHDSPNCDNNCDCYERAVARWELRYNP